MDIIYEQKTEDWALSPRTCNTNNHQSEMSDIEYHELVIRTNKSKWVDKFPDPEGSLSVTIPLHMCEIMLDVTNIGYIKGKRPKIYEEELEELERIIEQTIHGSNINKWFIRLKNASPKDGYYGPGPLLSAKEMVTSLSTSLRAKSSFRSAVTDGIPDILYIIPWRDDWRESLEFRVFVYKNHVSAISQYIWHRYLGWNHDTISIIAPKIITFCNDYIIPKMEIDNYVVDVTIVTSALDPNNGMIPEIKEEDILVELVEFNSFGAELSSGGALFHWLDDHDILYNEKTTTVRYITKM